MKIITSIFDLNKEIKDYKNIGFVPTMGGIHAGHISLIKASQNKKNKTIVSIFVNPAQFNKIKELQCHFSLPPLFRFLRVSCSSFQSVGNIHQVSLLPWTSN